MTTEVQQASAGVVQGRVDGSDGTSSGLYAALGALQALALWALYVRMRDSNGVPAGIEGAALYFAGKQIEFVVPRWRDLRIGESRVRVR